MSAASARGTGYRTGRGSALRCARSRRDAGRRFADQRRAVAIGPGDVDGCLVPRHQSLVAVHSGVRDGRDRRRVLEDPCDEGVCRFGEVELVVLVVEGVLAVLEQREVRVHARAVDARDRLGHERRVEVVLCGDGADDGAEGADVVRRRERVVVFEVDLVLAPGNLVVARFDLEAHILEAVDDVTSNVAREVFRCEVEIAAVVARLRRCTSPPRLLRRGRTPVRVPR